MWLKKTVAVVIPAGRNKKSIFGVIQDVDATGYVDEIIVTDNGADIDTFKMAEKTRAKFVKQNKYGLGKAIKKGIKETKADLIIITEPDGSFKGKDISKLLSYSEDFDTVFGSRTNTPLIGRGSGMTFTRRFINDLFGKAISILFLSSNLTDVRCSMRLTNQKGWKKVVRESKSDDDIFLTEWLIAAAKNRVRFIEIPVNYTAPKTKDETNTFPYLAIRGLHIFYLIIKTWVVNLISKVN